MATEDYGILISQPGVDVDNAKPGQITLNTRYPFIKLDTQNPKAFQSLLLLITNDPPEPAGPATHAYTTVASFAHGYKYIPSLETLFYVSTAPPATAYSQTYFQDSGILGLHTVADSATLYAVADATNVYFIVDKYNAGGGTPNLLTGTNVQITVHVFAEDIGI